MFDQLRRQTVFDVVLTIAGIAGLSVLLIGDGSCMGYTHASSTASASPSIPSIERDATARDTDDRAMRQNTVSSNPAPQSDSATQ